jgi:hypothetical protein
MSDPAFALSEQFCLARSYAIALGEDLARKFTGFSPQQIVAQCDMFGPAMREYVSALFLEPRDAMMQDVGGFILNTGCLRRNCRAKPGRFSQWVYRCFLLKTELARISGPQYQVRYALKITRCQWAISLFTRLQRFAM